MRNTLERLRAGILLLGALLLIGILSIFAYARWQLRRIPRDLPAKLGIAIQQSTNGYTFSKSEGGHTSITLHAAKMIEYKSGGKMALQNVSIALYRAVGTEPDRIYGKDFDYDPGQGLIRANGAVEIELQGPASVAPAPGSSGGASANGKGTVHLETSDLLFNQKTGVASTPQHIEFHIAQSTGNATGATFDSRTGALVLSQDVTFHSNVNGRPLDGRARSAEFDRLALRLHLQSCSAEYANSTSSSDDAILHFRQDGSVQELEAAGHVSVDQQSQRLTSDAAHADFSQKSEPEHATFEGHLLFESANGQHSMLGNAGKGTLLFGPDAQIEHARLQGAVAAVDQLKIAGENARTEGAGPEKAGEARAVEASQIDIDFAPAAGGRPVATDIVATGGARFSIETRYVSAPPQRTEVRGDRLLVVLQKGSSVSDLRGTGHTSLTMIRSDGSTQTSTGDHLSLAFEPPAVKTQRGRAASSSVEQTQLKSAEQDGDVLLKQEVPPAHGDAGTPLVTTATAQRATYDAGTELVHLSGNPHLQDEDGDVAADSIDFERKDGIATASGGVKATYRAGAARQPGHPQMNFAGPGPIHVIADHARMERLQNIATFYGQNAADDARLWQGSNSVSAPVLELSNAQGTLFAHGADSSAPMAVTAVLVSGESGGASETRARAANGDQAQIVRVISRTLLYTSATRVAAFRGGVQVLNPAGDVTAGTVNIFLEPLQPGSQSAGSSGGGSAGTGAQTSQVEKIVATGNVKLQQPGRKGTGQQLVYTAKDGNFLLTGTSKAPPRLEDALHGTVTGASLIFNDRDDSVVVNGGLSKAVTETHTAK